MIDYEPSADREPLWSSVAWWLAVSAVSAFVLFVAMVMALFVLFFEAD